MCRLSPACPKWAYGPGCSEECQCVQQNTLECHRNHGSCVCKPGYQGKNCQEGQWSRRCSAHTHERTQTHACTCTHTRMCTRTHKHTHAFTYTYTYVHARTDTQANKTHIRQGKVLSGLISVQETGPKCVTSTFNRLLLLSSRV